MELNNTLVMRCVFLMLLTMMGLGVGVYFYGNRSYGEVSPSMYQATKAVYAACLSRNNDRLSAVEDLLMPDSQLRSTLQPREVVRLEKIIGVARRGDWESSAQMARKILKDQVTHP